MGYIGDNLSDYYGYQLLDEVINQLKSKTVGDINLLKERLKEIEKLMQHEN